MNNLLSLVNKPGRYLGLEHNAVGKPWDQAQIHCALVFPDLYEIGMSHQGLQILYHLLNGQEQMLADRSYCPDKDLEQLLTTEQEPLTALESGRPLIDFDIIGITLPYELCYSNIITILKLAGIPLYAKDRKDGSPLLLGGGSCSMNPEPVADFFDAIFLGDGEEGIIEVAEIAGQAKKEGWPREQLLETLSQVPGVYIPSLFSPEYDDQGRISAITPNSPACASVTRRVLPDLNRIDHLTHPLVPNSKIVHDRLGVEIARGCTRGCRFCQAGVIYRPVRERSPEQIMELVDTGISDSGFDELALLSLSTGDYSCLDQLLPSLMDRFADQYVSVAMPSMRVGTLTQGVMDQIKRVRKTGFTLAPEAGSERLRRVINKGITEEDLLTTSRDAYGLGWKVMKLYFMIGLPTETPEDIDAISDLAQKTLAAGDGSPGRRQITVSIGTFVPKPHTPFQWAAQMTMAESYTAIRRLKAILPRKNINLKWHDPEQSFLEGVFSRGDRRLARLLEKAWDRGARLDGWSDHFQLKLWQEAAEKDCGLDLDFYLRPRDLDEILPWQHLKSGISTDFLKQELTKAQEEAYTPDCRYHGCQLCGLCDFKTLRPVVQNPKQIPAVPSQKPAQQVQVTEPGHFKYQVTYQRLGKICLLGHLEILQLIFRVVRRAGLETHFSQGFNPSPKISFGPAMPVGTESLCEYFIMDLPALLDNPHQTTEDLNCQLPEGLMVTGIALHSGKLSQSLLIGYTITCPRPFSQEESTRLMAFLASGSHLLSRTRKGKTKAVDIRPLVSQGRMTGPDTLELELISTAGQPGIKPQDFLSQVIGLDDHTTSSCQVLKTTCQAMTEQADSTT